MLTLLLLMPSLPVVSAERVLDDEALYRYAMHLYRKGEYYRAVTEYKRLLHFFPESPRAGEAQLQIGRSYMAGGLTAEAVAYWREGLERGTSVAASLNRYRILYGISLLDHKRTDPYRLRLGHIQAAIDVLEDVEARDEESSRVQDFVQDWKTLPEPDTKSPWLAGTMSAVVPGAGSLYSGRRMEALYAFFLTSLFYLATVDAVNSDNVPLTGVFGFFTLAFYGGNIYAAVNSTHKHNDRLHADALTGLRRQHDIWFVPGTDQHNGRF